MKPPSVNLRPVVFAGAAVWDTIALVRRYPEPDERTVAEDVRHAGGGPAATAAVAAARLGVRAAFAGTVGDDEDGRWILSELQAEHVDVGGVSVVAGERSAASVVVVDSSRGTRAICTRPGPVVRLNDTATQLLGAAEWVHVDHIGWAPVHQAWQALPARDRPRLSVDAGNPIDGLLLADVELFVPTAGALARRYGNGGARVEALIDAALAEGAKQVVATRGADGCVAATASGCRFAVPGLRVDVISTLGAGDVFHGGLLAAVTRGLPMPECLRYANTAAALSCRALDGRSAIPSHDEVLRASRRAP